MRTVTDRPLVVLASRYDTAAHRFVRRHAAEGACLLTPDELSCAGWHHRVGHPESGLAVVAGRILATPRIAGVLTRLPYVVEQDLQAIVAEDRAYVAAEMNAFLLSWLHELQCPVVNRPAPHCLAGPNWRPEKWLQTAQRIGVPIQPLRRSISPGSGVVPDRPLPARSATVTVIGRTHLGNAPAALIAQAQALADAAKVDLLNVRFSGRTPKARFVSADYWPDIGRPVVGDAVLSHFRPPRPGASARR